MCFQKHQYQSIIDKLYFDNKQSHFKTGNTGESYCETFYIPDHSIYGIFDFRQFGQELNSNLTISSKHPSTNKPFYLQEKYSIVNGYKTVTLHNFDLIISVKDIDPNVLKIILQKTDDHIIRCSCC